MLKTVVDTVQVRTRRVHKQIIGRPFSLLPGIACSRNLVPLKPDLLSKV